MINQILNPLKATSIKLFREDPQLIFNIFRTFSFVIERLP